MDRNHHRPGSAPARPTPGEVSPRPEVAEPVVYRVRVSGHLDDRWADWRNGLSIEREEGGDTVLTARVVDQAALHGLLRKLRDVGARLVSVNPGGAGTKKSSKEEHR